MATLLDWIADRLGYVRKDQPAEEKSGETAAPAPKKAEGKIVVGFRGSAEFVTGPLGDRIVLRDTKHADTIWLGHPSDRAMWKSIVNGYGQYLGSTGHIGSDEHILFTDCHQGYLRIRYWDTVALFKKEQMMDLIRLVC